MYKKWKVLSEFQNILTTIDDGHQATNTTADDITDEAAWDDKCMDAENGDSSRTASAFPFVFLLFSSAVYLIGRHI
jgi:hypothetical protein